MDKVRIAMIGLGNIGNLHLGNIEKQPKVELTAVCDIVPEKAKAAAEKYGVKAYFDSDKLLADRVCDAVIIGTPHYFHTTIGIAAMNSGHHVLVEKPMAADRADAQAMLDAAQSNSVRLMINWPFAWWYQLQHAIRLCREQNDIDGR